ncbi:74efd430-f868-4852-ace7-a691d73e47c0 [Thermothielavioides terrestris]|jgi:hypothetical protein|uniref:RING-type domain-containing protein n=2 Tax=Thermothielavioides terrestris TaxID=2587410 RepID=G2QQR8_THETT|nr:uncharacterized protein THITE_2108309 [Thermothielavioides terrestris NRRL 8126]AEO63278.1 hypothetical protein THITE_2108309 [Thermothielavioides terrestris NRRL 8126]SPQ21232.1 74efd430-f868-4852-ace7-a691d73e47c0 [Thermothielavioides terrestris]
MARTTNGGTSMETSSNQPAQAPGDNTCPICWQPILPPTVGRAGREGWSALPCGHRFGSVCIKKHLGMEAHNEPLCPVCRSPAYHEPCRHPVLPFVLDRNGNHPELVKDAFGKLRHVRGPAYLAKELCAYCLPPSGRDTALLLAADVSRVPPGSAQTIVVMSEQDLLSSPTVIRQDMGTYQVIRYIGGGWWDEIVQARYLDWKDWWNEQVPRTV